MNHFEKYRVWDNEKKQWFETVFNRYTGELREIYMSQNGELVLREKQSKDAPDQFTHLPQGEKTDPPRYIKNTYTGTRDKDGNKLFFNDIICFTLANGEKSYGVLVWMGARLGIGSGPVDNYHAIDGIDEHELRKADKAGNIYEHAHLIQVNFC